MKELYLTCRYGRCHDEVHFKNPTEDASHAQLAVIEGPPGGSEERLKASAFIDRAQARELAAVLLEWAGPFVAGCWECGAPALEGHDWTEHKPVCDLHIR